VTARTARIGERSAIWDDSELRVDCVDPRCRAGSAVAFCFFRRDDKLSVRRFGVTCATLRDPPANVGGSAFQTGVAEFPNDLGALVDGAKQFSVEGVAQLLPALAGVHRAPASVMMSSNFSANSRRVT
jgi:hypothetical protein